MKLTPPVVGALKYELKLKAPALDAPVEEEVGRPTWQSSPRSGRLWLTIGASVLATGGITALVFADRSEIKTTEEEIASLDGRIDAADVEIRKTKDREDEVIVFREVQNRELEILPKQQEIANFHLNLTTFLTQRGRAGSRRCPRTRPRRAS